jgi:hypothetical protein
MAFIMLNPSTADAKVNDNTVSGCIRRAKLHGYGGIVVGNAYAYRSTDPSKLKMIGDASGPDNDKYLAEIMADCETIVVAWGFHAKRGRALKICNIAFEMDKTLYCLGLTANGQPRHPLYIKGDTELKEFVLD